MIRAGAAEAPSELDYFDEEMEADLTSLNQWLGEKLAGFGFSEAEIRAGICPSGIW